MNSNLSKPDKLEKDFINNIIGMITITIEKSLNPLFITSGRYSGDRIHIVCITLKAMYIVK